MKELSAGTSIAWKIAAWETVAAKHQYIEKEHILIGICSLEKVLMLYAEKIGLNPQAMHALQAENNAIEDVLHAFNLDPTQLRRRVRERLGKGNYEHTEQVIHRSEECKKFFKRADEFAAGEISCLQLLAAIFEDAGEVLGSVLNEAGVKPADLRERAIAHAIADQLCRLPYITEGMTSSELKDLKEHPEVKKIEKRLEHAMSKNSDLKDILVILKDLLETVQRIIKIQKPAADYPCQTPATKEEVYQSIRQILASSFEKRHG